jgi:hypothetical protein
VQEIKKRREQHGYTFGEHYFSARPQNDFKNGEISTGKSRFDTQDTGHR